MRQCASAGITGETQSNRKPSPLIHGRPVRRLPAILQPRLQFLHHVPQMIDVKLPKVFVWRLSHTQQVLQETYLSDVLTPCFTPCFTACFADFFAFQPGGQQACGFVSLELQSSLVVFTFLRCARNHFQNSGSVREFGIGQCVAQLLCSQTGRVPQKVNPLREC